MLMLGYRPTVSLEAGIKQAISWYADHLGALTGKSVAASA
jgi:nucleoside-diphosphate-sugar epimerase